MQPGTRYQLEVNPKLPKRLARLEELAGNLWYSWDRATRSIFARLNPALWDAVGHNPKAMLKRIDEQRLIDAASDPAFLDSLTRVLAAFDTYQADAPFRQSSAGIKAGDAAGFPANDLDGHCLQNRSGADATVLEIGTRMKGSVAYYPDIDMVAPAGGKPAAYTHRDGTPYDNIRRRGP